MPRSRSAILRRVVSGGGSAATELRLKAEKLPQSPASVALVRNFRRLQLSDALDHS